MRGHPSGGSFKDGQINSPLWVRVVLDEGSSKRGGHPERSAGGWGAGGGGAGRRGAEEEIV